MPIFPSKKAPSAFAVLQVFLRVQRGKHLQELGHEASPTCLVGGPQAGAVIAMEILIEQDIIPPVGIVLEFFRAAIHRPSALLICPYFLLRVMDPKPFHPRLNLPRPASSRADSQSECICLIQAPIAETPWATSRQSGCSVGVAPPGHSPGALSSVAECACAWPG